MSGNTQAALERAEALIAAAGGGYNEKLLDIAEIALAHAVVLDHVGEHEAAAEQRALVEAACVVIDRRRRAAGLSITADEVI